MLTSQFKLIKSEERGVRDICIFTVYLYVKTWFTATSAISAPWNDLELLKNIDKYKSVKTDISQTALKNFFRYLWYFSEELIVFSFFDLNVFVEMKNRMVCALEKPGEEHP